MSDQMGNGQGGGADEAPEHPRPGPATTPPRFAGPGYGTPPAAPLPPAAPTATPYGAAPAWAPGSTPPAAPFGVPSVPSVPSAPGVPGAPTAPYGGVPQPYAGVPTVAQTLAGSAPDPYVRQERRRGAIGLPPSLGFAVMLLGFPALSTTFYGLVAILGGLVFSSFDDELGSEFADTGGSLVGIGFVVLVLGLIGIWAVVSMAAGSTSGRIVSTIFVGVCLLIVVVSFFANPSAGALIGLLIVSLIPLYCLWAMWGGRSREIF